LPDKYFLISRLLLQLSHQVCRLGLGFIDTYAKELLYILSG